MLTDFNLVKKALNIINKSFITLGKPLNFEGVNLYVRDTILLAPASSRSLDAISSLYESEGDYKKKVLPEEYKLKISKYLKADKKAFEEYAITDALIVLKHSTAMESFNFTLNKLGIPITLASMGKNYVLEK